MNKEEYHETIRNICDHYDRMIQALLNKHQEEIDALVKQVKRQTFPLNERSTLTDG